MSLKILNAIIHVLDRDSNEPILNEFEIDLSDELNAFLEKHIIKAINDDDAKKAVFHDGRNIVKETCMKICVDNSFFIEGSKDIARQLFKSMKTNNSISSTDLIVCLYENESETTLAIFKMDYNMSFSHDISFIDNKFKISIKKHETSLPGTNQKIQKCAFIMPQRYEKGYDLVVLDNQSGSKQEDSVAQFFIQNFLGAVIVNDSKSCTRLFKNETKKWIKDKIQEGNASVEEIRDHVVDAIFKSDDINIGDFSQQAFKNNLELKQDFMDHLRQKGLKESDFSVDKEWAVKRLNRLKLKTESNIELFIDYDDYIDRDKFEIIKNNDGTKNIVIKNVISILEK